MTNPQVNPRPMRSPRAAIRLAAIRCTGAIVVVVAAINLFEGRTIGEAVGRGVGAASAGLVCWMTYHLVGRRDDGLLLIGMSNYPFIQDPGPRSLGRFTLFYAAFGALSGLLFGLIERVRPSKPRKPPRSPLD